MAGLDKDSGQLATARRKQGQKRCWGVSQMDMPTQNLWEW